MKRFRRMVTKARGRYASPISNRELAIAVTGDDSADAAPPVTQLSLL